MISKVQISNQSFYWVIFLIGSLLIFSCQNEEVIDPEEEIIITDLERDRKDICTSTGKYPIMPDLKPDDQLLRILQFTPYNTRRDTFIYENDQLRSMEEVDSFGRRFDYEFEGDKLIQILTYDKYPEDRLIFRDSLAYDQNGNLLLIYNFSINAGENLPLAIVDSLFYDDQGYLNYHVKYSLRFDKYYSYHLYCWEDGNLKHYKRYNDEQKLASESRARYGDEIDFKEIHSDPRFWLYPNTWSTNDVIISEFIDHIGNIDYACDPCYDNFVYDDRGRLIQAQGIYGSIFYLYRNP